jgi:acyl dehydratase
LSSRSFAVGEQLPPYRVRAHNGAIHSENKIHDNEVARQYGFAGGLVPGVTIHAYMTRPVVDAFGRDWVERGTISTRFNRPFYEGGMVTVQATVTAAGDDSVDLDLQALNDAGEVCAVGTASLPAAPSPVPDIAGFPLAPLPASRPLADEATMRAMDVMGALQVPWNGKDEEYLDEIADDHSLWRGQDGVLHPGYLIRLANNILVRNVELGPWIHVSSEVTHFRAAPRGTNLTTRGRMLEEFERKGHRFVVLDVLVADETEAPVTRARHTAIYQVRRVNEG